MTWTFKERLLLGVCLTLAVLLAFLLFGQTGRSDLVTIGTVMIGIVAVVLVGKYVWNLSQLNDVYKVAQDIIPDLEAGRTEIIVAGWRYQLFQDYFLIEYPKSVLSFAWDKNKGVVGRENMTLENFKKVWKPAAVPAAQPVQVVQQPMRRQGSIEEVDEGV